MSPPPRPHKYHEETPWEQLHTSQTDIAPVDLQGKDYNYRRPKTVFSMLNKYIFCFKLMLKLFFKMLSRNTQPAPSYFMYHSHPHHLSKDYGFLEDLLIILNHPTSISGE